MDARSLLDELLKTGQEMVRKGIATAEDKLAIPEQGEQRDAKLDGMKKGAVAAGVLALLLGTQAGRRITGSALKIGSLAAIGGIGWKAYQNWQAKNQDVSKTPASVEQQQLPVNELSGESADRRSLVLLRTMIAAAKADGHIDHNEIAAIDEQIKKLQLGDKMSTLLREEIAKPLDVNQIAALAVNQEMAAEMYLVSAVVTDRTNDQERAYLDSLAQAMNLPAALVTELEKARDQETT